MRALRAAGLRLGLVSNITLLGEWVREDLDRLGLLDLFDAVVLSSEEGIRKPHPLIYQTVLDRLSIEGRSAIFVGDRLREDIAGPQAAGMRAVLTHQFRREDPGPETAAPDAVIEGSPTSPPSHGPCGTPNAAHESASENVMAHKIVVLKVTRPGKNYWTRHSAY